ncbi:MAG TPA: serine/threonine protein kinase, partial [Polyangiaceae bacterium]|nr:serine/threonine protein kinase [Polyangiaceae bacterium]
VPYMVMELVEGSELTSVIRPGGIPARHAVLMAARIAEAADAAHRAGMVHRDLKPENVILDRGGGEFGLRLIDFGLAIVLDTHGPETRLTLQGRIVGTPEYMSPEQVLGSDTDGRTDIYALGVMLYELLVGVPPFRGETQAATLAMHLEDKPPPLELVGLPEDVATDLCALVLQMLEKRPEDRPDTADEVAQRLRELYSRLPDEGSPSGIFELTRERAQADTDTAEGPDTDISELAPGSLAPGSLAPGSLAPGSLEAGSPEGSLEAGDLDPQLSDPFVRREPAIAKERAQDGSKKKTIAWVTGASVAALMLAAGIYATVGQRGSGVERPPAQAPTEPPPDPVEPDEGRLAVESPEEQEPGALPTAGTVDLPGGQVQSDYEAALRALGSRLSAQGLRPRDVRSHPRAMRAWTAQSRAASGSNYPAASAQVGEFSTIAASKSSREWMVYRLQQVERALGEGASAEDSARTRALWSTLERASASPPGVRRWMRRVDEIDPRQR